jgi:hypothetical protein
MMGADRDAILPIRRSRPANDNDEPVRARTVTLRRRLEMSGLEVKVKIPVTEYVGVAVSTSITPEGVLKSAIELLHPTPDLNYLVFSEEGNANVVAEWQHWGKTIGVPLYIKAGDGSVLPYAQPLRGVGARTNRLHLVSDLSRSEPLSP